MPRRLSNRFAPLILFALGFLAVQSGVRVAMYAGARRILDPTALDVARIFGLGFAYDLATLAYLAVPLGLALALASDRALGARAYRAALGGTIAVAWFVVLFTAAAEWFFWDEFSSRFNFIAVDYLLYSREVFGNIWESYPVAKVLAGIIALSIAIAVVSLRLMRSGTLPAPNRRYRFAVAAALLAFPMAAYIAVDDDLRTETWHAQDNPLAAELAGNGVHAFFAALRANELDFARNYAAMDSGAAFALTRSEITPDASAFAGDRPHRLAYQVVGQGAERRGNVVLISVESLSANFLGAFGNDRGLTPNLDRLARESLFFTRVYATGTRTVRGLEALALSIPPTPGQSIVKRPRNEGLLTLGAVLRDKGYDATFVYGGYGYFDNMNHFFATNGYRVVDRTDIPRERIHHENIWGVADEDLFDAALAEMDAAIRRGTPFFAHVMTTSNHRPFTYPAGRIDIPSGSGRDGAVKYTDYAIGRFLAAARERPWFDDTIFVITADHTAGGRGKAELELDQFHIPLLVYAPGRVAPARIDRMISQIDIPPTILGLLNFSYRSTFFGRDVLGPHPLDERAFIANYQTVGFTENGVLVSLSPRRAVRVRPARDGAPRASDAIVEEAKEEAIALYQTASYAFRNGLLRQPAAD